MMLNRDVGIDRFVGLDMSKCEVDVSKVEEGYDLLHADIFSRVDFAYSIELVGVSTENFKYWGFSEYNGDVLIYKYELRSFDESVVGVLSLGICYGGAFNTLYTDSVYVLLHGRSADGLFVYTRREPEFLKSIRVIDVLNTYVGEELGGRRLFEM